MGCNCSNNGGCINSGASGIITAKAYVGEYSNNFPQSVPSGTLAYARKDCTLYIRDNCEGGCANADGWVELVTASTVKDLESRIMLLENKLKEVNK